MTAELYLIYLYQKLRFKIFKVGTAQQDYMTATGMLIALQLI